MAVEPTASSVRYAPAVGGGSPRAFGIMYLYTIIFIRSGAEYDAFGTTTRLSLKGI